MGQKGAAMTGPPDNDDARRKRLLWRASHRGIKEMDLIFGGFVHTRLAGFTAAELDELERMIAVPDQELLSWATKVTPVPPQWNTPLLLAMLGLPDSLLPRGEGGAHAKGVGG